ncbi:hypothetical protein [Sphingobacterium sp.]|uniref:hypothetical protein n=1 Tax=Sphingobacterium sp. TaxID=341027 RepID=UPI0028A26D77|nr:hypothetical protein [Sphingobacterium sp.]
MKKSKERDIEPIGITSHKKSYASPRITMVQINMEYGIAAGSVTPTNSSGEVNNEWSRDNDVNKEIGW